MEKSADEAKKTADGANDMLQFKEMPDSVDDAEAPLQDGTVFLLVKVMMPLGMVKIALLCLLVCMSCIRKRLLSPDFQSCVCEVERFSEFTWILETWKSMS